MQKVVLIAFTFTILLIGLALWISPKAPAIDTSKVTFFYSTSCVHCKQVEQFFTDQKIEEKITFERKEISIPTNLANLNEAVKYCKFDASNGIGVPFLFAEGKCYMGAPDVMSYFQQKLGLLDSPQPTDTPEIATPSSKPVDLIK